MSQRLYDGDGRKFRSYPAIIASFEPDTFAAICMVCDPGDNNYRLEYVEFDKDYLFRADYSKVKEAIDKASSLNSADYKNFSEVTKAIDSVVYEKEYPEQKIVDGYAKAIEDALDALEYIDADYSAVDEAIAKAGKLDKDIYEDFSDVTAAINAVERGKNLTEQQVVDEMAKAIENAIDSLKLKAAPKIIKGANQTVKQGDSAAFKSDADFSYFKYVLVDGKQISSDSYTIKEGTVDSQARIDVLPDLSNGLHQLGHSLCRKILRLHGNDYAICRRQRIQSYHTERRHTINQYIVIIVFDLTQIASQNGFTAHCGDKHHFHSRQLDVGREQIDIFLVMQNTALWV